MPDRSPEAVAERIWRAFYDSNKPAPYNQLKDALSALQPGDHLPGGNVVAKAEPTMDMGLVGAEAINGQMRGEGSPADYHAALDCYRAMLASHD